MSDSPQNDRDWWRGAVIYQIYPRSFQDSNGDGVGDLPGILKRIGHVASLGADAVWLSPVFTSPMEDMGYDVSNYRDIDPLFGSLEDFDELVAHAHDLGLKVIIDQVISHSSDQHPWFKESKLSKTNSRADWYVWADPNPDGSPPNNWASVFGGPAWEWNTTRRQYYLHNFLPSQPDLNFHNREVQDAVLDVLRFWLERGVDGFRFDTVNYYFHDAELNANPPAARKETLPEVNPYDMQDHLHDKNRPENLDFLKRVRVLLDEFDATCVGEVGEHQRAVEIMAAYTEGNERLHMAYSFDLLGPQFSVAHFRGKIEAFNAGAPHGWPCWSFSNHDVIRHLSRWQAYALDQDDLARQAAALLLSLRGSVCLYQGEELGLQQAEILFEELTDPPGIRFWPEYKGRDGCRTPMPWEAGAAPNGFTEGVPWLPVKPPHSERSAAQQDGDPHSVLAYYREILKFRKANPALVTGDISFFETGEPVLAFTRRLDDAAMLCVFNLSAAPVTVPLEGEAGAPDAISRGADVAGGALELTANGFAFFAVDAGSPVAVRFTGGFKPKA